MTLNLEITTCSETETFRLGVALGHILRPLDVVLLTGNLGTGKTRLAKGMISAATGVDPNDVVSPTFTLINRFEGTFPVFHADLYRLEGRGTDDLGLEDVPEEGGALIVEWAESVRDIDPDALDIFIEYGAADDARKLTLSWKNNGSWQDRIPMFSISR